MDMSAPFQAETKKEFPKAKIIFDKFHEIKVLSQQLIRTFGFRDSVSFYC
ncbi:hypothetical protein X924_03070 [Petrotoga sp. 9PWA.NaAc.5.4]|nr:hypothetical protein X924_03070 [Petrotoga sp. 9PWA.NaAc.5.4]